MTAPGLANRKSLEPYIKDDIKYYEHQVEGIRRAATMQSFILADEMGLGKSIQSLTVFGIDLFMGRCNSMIVICPTTLKLNWANEIDKFMGDVIYSVLPNKPAPARQKHLDQFSQLDVPRVLIMNYEQVKPHLEQLISMQFDIVLFDEAHMLKNPSAQRTKAARALAETCTRRFFLTGSPILNHVNDIWSLASMVDPAAFGSYYGFLNTYAVYGGYENREIVAVKNEQDLNAKLAQIMIRRLKKDVLDLPEVQITPRLVGLHTKQQKLYDQVLEDLQITRSENDEPDEIDNVLTKFLRLKQICGTTATVLENKEDYSDKLDAALFDAVDLVKQGERVVVFTQYRGVQEAFVNRLTAAFNKGSNRPMGSGKFAPIHNKMATFPVFVLNGDVPAEDRVKVVNEWADHEEPGVIVCIYSVAGTGLNMTAARYCQRLDKLFNPPLNQQAIDRLHRIGADKSQPVQVLDYLVKDSVEDRVNEILEVKQKIADSIVETDPLLKKAITQAMLEEKEKRNKK
ncbi:DNA helicase [Gordonia phage Gmala1]|uniref:Helicase n=3 Tax=Gordtnkvirus gordtnk2 TaxID=1982219 RepID=A0A0E3XAG4_9CAUD|nr:DNA helicase [Gordonia phage Gmala1]YP_009222512.1 DNA helicase [Gordonia phage GordDuk1]YP_009223968.1 DNA helicase [Gordonia phage GordTnk2]AKC02800.1 helicase [Gordonia phage GordTnk2]AKC02893.1 helicase [Gordonia phage Gmala1]AKC02987.1 helicase [Gordonia phage GordDuk1]